MGFLPGCGAFILLAVGFMNYIREVQLLDYLKKHHVKAWDELTRGGKSFHNMRVVKFSFSSVNFQDQELEKLKSKRRLVFYLLLYGFVAFVGLMFWGEIRSGR